MKIRTNINRKKTNIYIYLDYKINIYNKISIEDEFRQSISVIISMINPSSSLNLEIYERARIVHCKEQVSNKIRKKFLDNIDRRS